MIGIERMCLSCMVQGGGGSLDQATLPRASASPAARRCAGLSPSMARICVDQFRVRALLWLSVGFGLGLRAFLLAW